MARRKKTIRRKKSAVKRRTGSYYPKKGQRRLSRPSRARAYSSYKRSRTRRARRSNPKGLMANPAIRYSAMAGLGVALSKWADQSEALNPTKDDGSPMIPFGIKGGVLAALLAFGASKFILKGKNKQNAVAVGVGALIPQAINVATKAMKPSMGNGNGNGNGIAARGRRMRALPASTQSARSFVNAARALDNVA